MRLIRLAAAILLLSAGNVLLHAGSRTLTGAKAERAGPIPTRHPAERLLLASIIGIGICAIWIVMTWRAWG